MRWWPRRPEHARAARPERLAWRAAAPLAAVSDRRTPLVAAPLLRLPQVAGTTELVELPPLPPPQPSLRGRPDRVTATAAVPARRPAPRPPTWQETEWRPARPVIVDREAPALALTEATDEYVDLNGLSATDGLPHVGSVDLGSADLGPADLGPADLGPADLGPADADEPPTAATDDGLTGIIAMLDAEVARGRGSSADPFGPLAPPAPAEDRPTLLRPTLAESRRRGIAPGARPDEPAPTEPPSPPEPGSSADPLVTDAVPGSPAPAAAPAPPAELEPLTPPRPGPGSLEARTSPKPLAEPVTEPITEPMAQPMTEPGPRSGRAPRVPVEPDPRRSQASELAPEADHEPAADVAGAHPTSVPSTTLGSAAAPADARADEPPDARADEPAIGPAPDLDTVRRAPIGDDASSERRSLPGEPPPHLLPAADAWTLPRPLEGAAESDDVRPSLVPDEPRLDVVNPSAVRGELPAHLSRVARPSGDAKRPEQHLRATSPPIDALPRATDTQETATATAAETTTEGPAAGSGLERPRREHPVASPTPAPTPATTPAAAPAAPAAPDGPGVPVVAVPERAVASFSRMTGVDLGFVPLVRSVEATSESAQAHARAFTRGAVVHLPAEAGEPDRADNDALMGHELTHVMQQRALGAGAIDGGELEEALEAQAYAVERALRGEQVEPEDLVWPDEAGPEPGYLTWSAETGFGPAARGPVQRAPLAAEPAVADAFTSEAPPAGTATATDAEGAETGLVPLTYAQEPTWSEGHVGSAESSATPGDEAGREQTRHTVVVQRLDPSDPVLLDELAAGLYPRVRSKLRGELIADRERAGNLTEFS